MKTYLISIFLLITIFCQAQNQSDSTGILIYSRGLEYYNQRNLDSAIIVWQEIVDQKIAKKHDVYGAAFFNIPALYSQLKNFDKAKEWYNKVIASDLKDNTKTGLLMEPHTNYKHKSALALAQIFEIDSNYQEVLHWLNIADTVYRYWGFEGSATNVTKSQAYLLEWKTDIFLY